MHLTPSIHARRILKDYNGVHEGAGIAWSDGRYDKQRRTGTCVAAAGDRPIDTAGTAACGQACAALLERGVEIIAEKKSTEFTVQEVVDRSKQSLRSFYQYFDGKHELMLGLLKKRSTPQ